MLHSYANRDTGERNEFYGYSYGKLLRLTVKRGYLYVRSQRLVAFYRTKVFGYLEVERLIVEFSCRAPEAGITCTDRNRGGSAEVVNVDI
jgi:hypothetical protein